MRKKFNQRRAMEKAIKFFGAGFHMADVLRIDAAMVSRWLNLKDTVSLKRALQIEKLTKGLVKKEELNESWS